jgi:predicted outer membrane protein
MQNRLTMLLTVAGALCVTASVGHAQAKVNTSGGEVATLSQKHVVNHLIVGDSLELEAAQLAASKSQNAAVRDLATALATDNRAHLDNLRKLAAKSDLGREANAADSSAASSARDYAQLQQTADASFDQAFVNGQIENHTREIASLKALRASVKDPDLQQDIDAALPVIERHLEQAKQVATQLGAPADNAAAAKKPPTDAAADKPAADKPAADKAAADKPADAKSADAKPADAKPADAKPADAKPADAKPAGAKPDSAAKKPLPPKPPTI